MGLNRIYYEAVVVIVASLYVTMTLGNILTHVSSCFNPHDPWITYGYCYYSTSTEPNMDTSMYDFVSYGVFEEFVDLLEMIAWTGRRVKDNIDELLDNSFSLLSKQQDMLHPAIKMAEERNRKDCSESIFMNVTDIVFREFFNMNMNCPLIGQRMSIFFNEIHNVSTRIADIHRRYINRAGECGPPVLPSPNRECLQHLIEGCKGETETLRNFMFNLNQDVDEFMDGQEEEAFLCSLKGMSLVRDAVKKGIEDIVFCLDIQGYDYNKKYDSPMVREAMGLPGPFERIKKILDNETTPVVTPQGPPQYVPPTQPYYQPQMMNAQQPQMHQPVAPGMPHPQMHQPGPGMPHPQMQPGMYPPHPGMHPQPGMHPAMYPQPGMVPQQPEMQQQDAQQHQDYAQQRLHPNNLEETPPPWKIDTKKVPKFANKDLMGDGSLKFDSNFLENSSDIKSDNQENNERFDDEL